MAGSVTPTGGVVYPTDWGVAVGSEEITYDNLTTDRSFGGVIRIRSSVPLANIKKTFKVVHSALTTTQKIALETFYKTYRDSVLDLLWTPDGLYYATKIVDVPKYTILGGSFWSAEVSMAEI